MSVSVSTTAANKVSVSVDGATQLSFTTQESSVSVTEAADISVTVTEKGPKGDAGATGAQGPTGATGPAGADGKSYTVSCVDGDNSDEEKIRLTDNDGTTDDVVLEAGTGLSIARSGDKITFTNTITDTDTVLTSEQVQDIVGAMFSGNTETRISATYQDGDGNIDLVVDDMTADTQLTTEQVQDIVGAMFSGNTETRIAATYQDGDGNIDLVVDDMTANDNTTYGVSCVDGDNSDEEKIRLTDSSGGTDDVVLEAGTGLSIARAGDKITFTNTVSDTNTQLSTEEVQDIAGPLVATGGTKTNIAVTYDDASGNMDFVVASDLSTTGNAGTATALATARAINGVDFDGTAPITVTAAGSTLSDTVTVAKGGTGATSLTSDSVLTGAGTSAVVAEANLTFDGSILTVTGQRKIPSTTSSSQYYGDVVTFGSGPAGDDGDIEEGKLYYLDSSQQWEQTNANAASTATGMIAIAVVDDNARYLVKGLARHSSWSGFTTGDILYVSGTAGEITKTAPTGSADIVRIVGYCTNGGTREIYFDPSKDWVELS